MTLIKLIAASTDTHTTLTSPQNTQLLSVHLFPFSLSLSFVVLFTFRKSSQNCCRIQSLSIPLHLTFCPDCKPLVPPFFDASQKRNTKQTKLEIFIFCHHIQERQTLCHFSSFLVVTLGFKT